MDWKLFFATFAAIFMAEIGDKTQLAAITLTDSSRRPLIIFASASLALVSVTAIGVGFGTVVGKFIPEIYLKKGASALFILLGVWMWIKS